MSKLSNKQQIERKINLERFLDYILEMSKVCKASNAMIPINRARRLKLYGKE